MAGEKFLPFIGAGIQSIFNYKAKKRAEEAGKQAIGKLESGQAQLEGAYGNAQGLLGQQYDLYGQRGNEIGAMYGQYRDAGSQALSQLQQAILGGPEGAANALAMDPGYAFRQQQGEKAIQRAAAASGTLGSGENLSNFARFNQDLASQEYSNAINRLSGLVGLGERATNNLAGIQQNILGLQGSSLGQQAGLSTQLGQAQYGNAVNLANQLTGNAATLAEFDAANANAWSGAVAEHGKMVGQDRNNALNFVASLYGGKWGGGG